MVKAMMMMVYLEGGDGVAEDMPQVSLIINVLSLSFFISLSLSFSFSLSLSLSLYQSIIGARPV